MVTSGCLTQVSAKGPQDININYKPELTFFKGGHKRHTPFAIGEMETIPTGVTGFGRPMNFKIERNGDLLHKVYWKFELPAIELNNGLNPAADDAFYWTNSIGHASIDRVEVRIGGHVFDSHTGEFLEIWETISAPPEKRCAEMIGYSDSISGLMDYARKKQFIYTPLQFWFNRFIEQSLPLIALQYHEVHIQVTTKRLEELGVETGAFIGNTSFSNPAVGPAPTLHNAGLLCNYVFLDTLERRAFARQQHEYLIDQVQFTGSESHANIDAGTQSITLNYNHPTKQLIWVCQRDDVLNKATPFQGNDWFNWSGPIETIETYPGSGVNLEFTTEPILSAKIVLNGHERTIDHPAAYYRTVQMHQHHSRVIDRYIYTYSFAIQPQLKEPTGTLNLSRIDNTIVRLTFPTGNGTGGWIGSIRFYARSFNLMKISSGMAGLYYAN